jgi:hypothetical protein
MAGQIFLSIPASMWDFQIPTQGLLKCLTLDITILHKYTPFRYHVFFFPSSLSPFCLLINMLHLERFAGSTLEPSSEPIILYSDHVKSDYKGPLRGVVTSPLKRSHKPPPIHIPHHNPYLHSTGSSTAHASSTYSPWSGRTVGDERPFFLWRNSTLIRTSIYIFFYTLAFCIL